MPRISAKSVIEHRRQTSEKILDAVEEILEESQTDQNATPLTVGTVAKRLGMGRSSLYRYHNNVDDMIEAVVVRDFPRRAQVITDQMDDAPGPLDAIEAYARASFREARESRHSWRSALSRVHLDDDARARIGRLHAKLTQALAREVDKLPDIPAELKPELISSIQSLINAGVTAMGGPMNGHGGAKGPHGREVTSSSGGEDNAESGHDSVPVMQHHTAVETENTRAVEPLDNTEVEDWYVTAIQAVITAAQSSVQRPTQSK